MLQGFSFFSNILPNCLLVFFSQISQNSSNILSRRELGFQKVIFAEKYVNDEFFSFYLQIIYQKLTILWKLQI